MKLLKVLTPFLIVALLLSACGSPTPAAEPTQTPAPVAAPTQTPAAAAKVTDYSIKIEQEQGSGAICQNTTTYLVTAMITADGVTAANFEVSAASSGGQIPAGGNFQDLTNNGLSQSITSALAFDKAQEKTITWRLIGPYSYPNDITVKMRVNGGEFKSATLDCGSAAQPATATAPAASTGCKDSALYVSDDGKDGTTYAPGVAFTKTWKIRNSGACTWDSSYFVNFVSGKTMTQQPGYMIVPPGGQVAPGADVDISVDMLSPSQAGDYRADWQLQNGAGASLVQFFTTLKVKDQTSGSGNSTGSITGVVPQMVLEQGSGNACTDKSTYFVYVDVTSDGAATADYRIDLTDGSGQTADGIFDSGAPEEKGSLTFDSAGTQRISLHVKGPYGYPDSITVRVYVNELTPTSVVVSCQ